MTSTAFPPRLNGVATLRVDNDINILLILWEGGTSLDKIQVSALQVNNNNVKKSIHTSTQSQ